MSSLCIKKCFNAFMYDQTLPHGRKHFCFYCLQAYSTEEILQRHIKDCLKINCKQRIKMPKRGEYVRFKYYERKIKSPFMIYKNFESILVAEDNGKQNLDDSYTNKYLKHVYVLMISLVKLLSHNYENTVYNFISSIIEESSKYCTDITKKIL